MNPTGKVYLVGAGPGDPGLLTLKGRDCIAAADVIIYDYLAAPALLHHTADAAEKIYVGKKGGDHTLSQEKINRLIVEKAAEGLTVTRLKGGDPFIFGRGGEEAEALLAAGIPFEIVPGVTSAIAAPAYAGIPLTHRDFTASVAFVTGHEDPTKPESNIHWAGLATGVGTLVFLMGVKNLPHITTQLIQNGKSPETPVALVRWGTTSRQQTLVGTLGNIVEKLRASGLKAPAITVVGEVVRLRDKLKWFETRPLLGKRILVTRAREQASDLVSRLIALGAECVECPTIRIMPPPSWDALDQAIDAIDDYDWIIFTSVNGVRFFFDRLFGKGKDVRAIGHLKTAAIGPVTAEKMRAFGLLCDILPDTYRAESVAAAFKDQPMDGKRVLLPRAMEARPVLPVELGAMGARVDETPAYRTEIPSEQSETLLNALRNRTVDAVTFTSSSTVKNFLSLIPESSDPPELLKGVTLASIGPITTETAESLGLKVHVTATTFTIPGLCEALVDHFHG